MTDQAEMKLALLKGARLSDLPKGMQFEEITGCWCGGQLESWSLDFEPYVQCAECGCKCVRFQATRRSLEEFYSEHYWYDYQTAHGCPAVQERYETDMLDRIPAYLNWIGRTGTPPARILEVGCGNGRLLHELALRGYDCEASEMDPDIAAWVTNKTGIAVYPGAFPPADSQPYDLILLIDVLEHVRDPIQFVEEVRRRLSPAGRVLLHCPVIDSIEAAARLKYLFNPISHLWMHTTHSMERLWTRAGMQPEKIGELFGMPGLVIRARAS